MNDPYHQIDVVIAQWVERNGFTLFTGTEGHDDVFRNVYLSSPAGECCQIWIDPPQDGSISVHAADVESRNDEPMRADWITTTSELSATLDAAVAYLKTWFSRQ